MARYCRARHQTGLYLATDVEVLPPDRGTGILVHDHDRQTVEMSEGINHRRDVEGRYQPDHYRRDNERNHPQPRNAKDHAGSYGIVSAPRSGGFLRS